MGSFWEDSCTQEFWRARKMFPKNTHLVSHVSHNAPTDPRHSELPHVRHETRPDPHAHEHADHLLACRQNKLEIRTLVLIKEISSVDFPLHKLSGIPAINCKTSTTFSRVQRLPNQRHPRGGRSFVLSPKNIPCVQRNYLLKPVQFHNYINTLHSIITTN